MRDTGGGGQEAGVGVGATRSPRCRPNLRPTRSRLCLDEPSVAVGGVDEVAVAKMEGTSVAPFAQLTVSFVSAIGSDEEERGWGRTGLRGSGVGRRALVVEDAPGDQAADASEHEEDEGPGDELDLARLARLLPQPPVRPGFKIHDVGTWTEKGTDDWSAERWRWAALLIRFQNAGGSSSPLNSLAAFSSCVVWPHMRLLRTFWPNDLPPPPPAAGLGWSGWVCEDENFSLTGEKKAALGGSG